MLDKALIEALDEVVAEEGQPKSVALRLAAWLTQMSSGEPSRDENTQYLANVREALVTGTQDAD